MPRIATRRISTDCGRLQVDDEIRRRRIELERLGDLLVQTELVRIEIELGEELVLLQQEIGDPHGREHVALANLLDLPSALEQEEQLRWQRRVAPILVEALEKRVLLGLLEDQLAREALREPLRETRLAYADRSFDDDEPGSIQANDFLGVARRLLIHDRSGIRRAVRPEELKRT